MKCEVNRSPGYDPTGEWAVECGAEGEYCPICELAVCSYCHEMIANDRHHHVSKKPPAGAKAEERREKAS